MGGERRDVPILGWSPSELRLQFGCWSCLHCVGESERKTWGKNAPSPCLPHWQHSEGKQEQCDFGMAQSINSSWQIPHGYLGTCQGRPHSRPPRYLELMPKYVLFGRVIECFSLGLGPRNIYIYMLWLGLKPSPIQDQCFGLLAASFKYVDVLSDMTDASMPHALKPKYFVLFI